MAQPSETSRLRLTQRHAGLCRLIICNEKETKMNQYRENVAYALQRAREYVSLGDLYMARTMTACAELNAQLARNAETQILAARKRNTCVSIPLNS